MTSFKRIIISMLLITMLSSPVAYASEVSQPRTLWEDFTAYIQQIGPEYANRAIMLGFSIGVSVFLLGQHVGRSRALARVANTPTPVLANDNVNFLTLGTIDGTLQEKLTHLYAYAKQTGSEEILKELGKQVVFTGKNGFQMRWKELAGETFADKFASLLKMYLDFKTQLLK